LRTLLILLLLCGLAYADSTDVIFHHNPTDAGEAAVVDSVVYHQIYYLDDSVGAGTHVGPDTGAFWDTVRIDGVYLFGLSAAMTYYFNNAFDDTEYVLADNIEGEFAANTPGGPDTCQVWGYISDIGGTALETATITAILRGYNVRDTCNDKIVGYYKKTTTSNSAGYWSIPLIKTGCLSPGKTYTIEAVWGSGKWKRTNITVPDSASYRIK